MGVFVGISFLDHSPNMETFRLNIGVLASILRIGEVSDARKVVCPGALYLVSYPGVAE